MISSGPFALLWADVPAVVFVSRKLGSNPIFLLSFMFLGGPMPARPFPECGPSQRGEADCDLGVCF